MENIPLQQIWNTVFDGMILINSDGAILEINRSAMRLFSLSANHAENTSIFELIPIEFKKYFTHNNNEHKTGIPLSFGTEEFILSITPVCNNFLLIIKSMTKLQQLKFELHKMKESKYLFDLILDKLDEGVCAIDSEGRVIFYNKKMGDFDLLEPDAVKSKRLYEAFPNFNEYSSKLLKSLQLSKTLNHRETHFNSSGKAITSLSQTYPLSVGNKKMGAVEILKDITEQKNLLETIQKLQKKDEPIHIENKQSINNHTRFKFNDIIFNGRKMRQTVEQARRASYSSSNILLIGETGTGKELFAQSIHNESSRQSYPFVGQNCAALPENLLESLLFGTSVGSFTGAVEREGFFEQAHKGTLLLDEINSMGLNLQAKLLRCIQEKRVSRLGSKKIIDTDVRIIATINEDPYEAIKNGRLREDLYYRLSVVNLEIPPLRNRKEDIPALVNFFIKKHAKVLNIEVKGIDEEVLDLFVNYSWPGNVRQLEHAIEGCLNLIYDEKLITFDHLSSAFQKQMIEENITKSTKHLTDFPLSYNGTLEEQKEQLERSLIEDALNKSGGNVSKASESLGISRQNLNYKLKKYHLSKVPFYK
ncbi:sigma 54-interacting transcriptional regulator [Scopulibacillus cellulosilyticus]|uniref:Sigma 54-interacting transcriptional regulator n=1 Tax=Scopulibacillus cellulosilyticus TaxID=2665665 RepID=A0ABW2PX29_9BACL